MIGRSHLIMAAALVACASGFGGFLFGVDVGVAREQAARKRADDEAEKVRASLQGQIEASSQSAQSAEYDRQGKVREIIRESQKIVDRPVYRDICVDADGVGLLDRAAASANADDLWGVSGDTRPVAPSPAD